MSALKMLPSHLLHLRSALTSLKAQPVLLTPSCAFTTTSNPIQRRFFINRSSTRPSTTTTTTTPTRKPHHKTTIRFESTTVTPLSPSSSSTTSTSNTPSSPPSSPSNLLQPLTWNAYLSLRKTRRRYNLVSSIISSLLTAAGGMSFLTRYPLEQINIFGMDPIMVMAMALVGSGGLGWLMGPFLGNEVFEILHRKVGPQIAEKEVDFYRRIKKHRVDGSGGSSANPVPDYYGEKIGSVKEYRNWMKDQRAFNRRRQHFL